MSIALRVVLIVGACIVLMFVISKIRQARFSTGDSLFWLLLSFGLVVLALFPSISFFLSGLLGVQSPSNFIFLAVIALLLVREFSLQNQIAQLTRKITTLAQEIALKNEDRSRQG